MSKLLARLHIDPYIASIFGTVAVASAIPATGIGMVVTSDAGTAMIAAMFFLQGARLSPQAALAGARHWRLHVVVLTSTFLVFPTIGLLARAVAPDLLTPPLWTGLLMLCVLPSTVQSSIAFTSIARGNVAAALCAATASNLFGILLTPVLAGLVLRAHGGFSAQGVGDIVLQLLLLLAHSAGAKHGTRSPSAFQSAPTDRSALARSNALSLAKACSIGLRSGLCRRAPAPTIAFRVQ